MHVGPLLVAGIVFLLVFSGCAAQPATSSGQRQTKLGAERLGGLVKYDGPHLAIMDTPAGNFTKCITDAAGCLRRLTTAATGPANENMVQIDYSNPNFLIAGAKDYHADNPTCVVVSVYTSTDGGRTWRDGYPRPTVGVMGGPSKVGDRCESDPVAVFDGRGNGFMLTLDTGQGIFTYRTEDQGKSWKEVAMAFKGGNDKNWGATDYRIHRIYSITRATCNGGEGVTYSDDSGETWFPKDKPAYCFNGMDFGQIDVGPDGTVYACGTGQGGLAFAKSIDGGQTWTTPMQIVNVVGASSTLPIAGGHVYRTPTLCDMAVSIGTGAIYVVWHITRNNQQDALMTASFDGGDTWAPQPIVVSLDPSGADQFMPVVAASPNGDAHVFFMDARNDPTGRGHVLDGYYAHVKVPKGTTELTQVTVEPNIRLTPQSFVPYFSRHQQQPAFIGDYFGIVATNNEAVMTFPVTFNERAELVAAVVGG